MKDIEKFKNRHKKISQKGISFYPVSDLAKEDSYLSMRREIILSLLKSGRNVEYIKDQTGFDGGEVGRIKKLYDDLVYNTGYNTIYIQNLMDTIHTLDKAINVNKFYKTIDDYFDSCRWEMKGRIRNESTIRYVSRERELPKELIEKVCP